MLDQLLETKQATQRKPFGTVVSVVLHAVLIAIAVQLTQQSVSARVKPIEVLIRQPIPKTEPKPDVAKPPLNAVAHAPAKFGFQLIQAPTDIPVDLPALDLNAAPTDARDWTGNGVAGGRGMGVVGGGETTHSDEPLFVFQVDKPAAALPGTAQPAYPAMLTSSGVEGQALVQFVVDTLGRAEQASFKVLSASHEAFGLAVRAALPRMRFLPAEAGGRKVRMLVQQQFAFAINP
jgi:periplasmic protein TonB